MADINFPEKILEELECLENMTSCHKVKNSNKLFSLLIMTMAKVEQFLMYESNLKRPRPLDDAQHWACSCNANTNIKDDSARSSLDGTNKRTRFKD